MDDEERSKLVRKLQKDVEDHIANLKPKKYEDGWPEDKWEEEMEKHPIFMSKPLEESTELPPLVEAMQQLKYDSDFNSSKELALSYKEDGNQNFKRKKYRWAVEAYSKALEGRCEDKELNAVLHTNRAIAQYRIGNYRKALKDATEAKALNPQHFKAIFRGATCCYQLGEYDNCVSWCHEGLQLKNDDTELLNLKKKAEEKKAQSNLAKNEASAKALQEKFEIVAINKALKERGIQVHGKGLSAKSFESIYPEAQGSKVCLAPEGELVWPVLILYPEFGTSDYIQSFNENTCFYDHLSEMFKEPPSWDSKGMYRIENLQVYYSDSENSLVEVDKMASLQSVMCKKSFKVKSGTLSFLVTAAGTEFHNTYQSQNTVS